MIGDYVIVARKAKNTGDWFLGAITDEQGRTFTVPLDFLTPGRKYVAEIYADGPGANWATNPLPVSISKRNVDSSTKLSVVLAPGGGQAIRFTAAK
jgi:alpha-glucosidase